MFLILMCITSLVISSIHILVSPKNRHTKWYSFVCGITYFNGILMLFSLTGMKYLAETRFLTLYIGVVLLMLVSRILPFVFKETK